MHQSPICLNVSMFAQIIRDPASSTEEVSSGGKNTEKTYSSKSTITIQNM